MPSTVRWSVGCSPHLRADGLVGQALTARRRQLLRFAQLWRATPHATNRYLDLLAFVRQRTPTRSRLTGPSSARPGESRTGPGQARRRRPDQNAPVVGIALAAVALLGGLITGVAFHNFPWLKSSPTPTVPPQARTATAAAATRPDSPPTESPRHPRQRPRQVRGTAELLALVPAGIQGADTRYQQRDWYPVGSYCHPGGDGGSLYLYAYTDSAAMTSAFKDYVGDLSTGSCSTGEDRQGTWTYSNITKARSAANLTRRRCDHSLGIERQSRPRPRARHRLDPNPDVHLVDQQWPQLAITRPQHSMPCWWCGRLNWPHRGRVPPEIRSCR